MFAWGGLAGEKELRPVIILRVVFCKTLQLPEMLTRPRLNLKRRLFGSFPSYERALLASR